MKIHEVIKAANITHARRIAVLHDKGLSQSFLRKLGLSFLTSMYRYLIKHELVYVYLENDEVYGFISASLSSDKVMHRFITNRPGGVFHLLFAVLKRPRLLKSIYETYRSAHSSPSNPLIQLPSVELLSIVVSGNVQQGGVGSLLLLALESELKHLGIKQFKVVAGEKLIGANRFYLRNGFEKATQITIHGDDVSNVYVKNL